MADGGFIYAIGVEGLPSIKIGKTAGPVARRLAALQIGHPAPLKVLATVAVADNLSRIEKAIHRFLAKDRQQSEWFAVQVDQEQLEALIVRAVQWLHVAAQYQVPLAHESAMTIGKRVRQRRRALDITQEKFEELTGVKQSHLSAIESDRIKIVKSDTLITLARALRVSTDWLLGLDEKKQETTDSEQSATAVA